MTHRITRVSGADPQLPVTLEQVKAHLRITQDAEDELLNLYLIAAVDWCEEVTHRAINQRSYLVVDDDFPSGDWRLPLGYIDSITSVQYIDSAGATQTWTASPEEWQLDNASDSAARLSPKPNFSWPDVGEYPSAARVTLVAGWSVDNVPTSIAMAVLKRIGQLYESRAPGDPEADIEEAATRSILAPWVLPIWA